MGFQSATGFSIRTRVGLLGFWEVFGFFSSAPSFFSSLLSSKSFILWFGTGIHIDYYWEYKGIDSLAIGYKKTFIPVRSFGEGEHPTVSFHQPPKFRD